MMELAFSDEADDVPRCFHGLFRDGPGTVRAINQYGIDMRRICDQPLHFGGDRGEPGDAKFDQRILEAGELSAAEFPEPLGFAGARPPRVNPDEVVSLGSGLETLFLRWQRLRIGLRLADL